MCHFISTAVESSDALEVQHTFLATVIVYIHGKNGNRILANALIDSGAQASTISDYLLTQTGLHYENVSMAIEGINGLKTSSQKKSIIKIESRSTSYNGQLEVYSVAERATFHPSRVIDIEKWKIPKNSTDNSNHELVPAETQSDIFNNEIQTWYYQPNDMHYEEFRLQTFDKWPHGFINPQNLARIGFYFC